MPVRRPVALLAAAAVLALSACATGDPGTPADPGASGGGALIEHAFGETTVPEDPQRVVTLGWGATDAAIALGVVPVGIEAQAYGGNEQGVQPWVEEALDELGAETPTVIPSSTEEPAYEDIAALEPDLILAPYSGITEDQYELLSDLAPTVAYPEAPWTTPWRDTIEIVGTALGKEDEATDVLNEIDERIAAAAAEHPEFDGLTVAAVWDVAGTFYVYKPEDARVEFLFELGFQNAPAVDELANGDSTFTYSLSYEELDKLDSDVLVAFADTQTDAQTFLAQPYAATIPAVKTGAVASVTGTQLIAAVSPPTALSLTWGLDDYVAALAEAAAVARG